MKSLLTIILSLIFSSVATFAAQKAEAIQESPLPPDPQHPSTLDSRDPSFEELAVQKYKPNANYKIREFKDGSLQTLSGTLQSLEQQGSINLQELSKLQSTAHKMNYTDKERWVASLADLRKQQEQFLSTVASYKGGIYQTNISIQSLRTELKTINNEVANLRNLLGSWQKENKTAWE